MYENKAISYLYWFYCRCFFQTNLPLPLSHLMVLILLRQQAYQSPMELCEKLHRSKQQIHRVLNGLEKNQFISRQVSETDHRTCVLSLTLAGHSLVNKYEKKLQEAFETMQVDMKISG